MIKTEFNHIPVMLHECIDGLNIKPGGVYIDGTLGGGNHSLLIAETLDGDGTLIGIDRDEEAITAAFEALWEHRDICTIVRGNFADIKSIMDNLDIDYADGVLLDLGVSSHQLDDPSRGFSFMQNSFLDMRMDNTKEDTLTAYDVVNTYSKKELENILYSYGEERWAARIAGFITEARQKKPIETTFELVDIIKAAIPRGARDNSSHHPATKTYMALRIEVNNELNILKKAIFDIVEKLNKGGRLAVITFHSLEDRIVKNAMRELENPCMCPKEFPVCICGKEPLIKRITKKPIEPSDEEIYRNNRARSAKLRVIEKL